MLCYLRLYRDPTNLKSPAHCERAGSSPAPGTMREGVIKDEVLNDLD